MTTMKVAFITPGSFPIPSSKASSVETVVEQFCRTLAGTGKAEVLVYGRKVIGQPTMETIDGVSYRRPPIRKGSSYIKEVAKSLIKEKPKLIQVENRPKYAPFLRKLLPSTPIWLSLHSVMFIRAQSISRKELLACLKCVDKIIVNSQFLKEEVIRYGVKADRIAVNHLGVDTTAFVSRWSGEGTKLRDWKLTDLGLQGKKIILYVGRLIPIKGVHHLLKAMPQIVSDDPEVVLIIVGGAFYGSTRTTAYVRKLHQMGSKLKRNVLFVPYVPHDQIQDWFRLADVVVVPSANKEAFGLVNVEAMACGIPVIATYSGGMSEVVDHGVTGLLVEEEMLEEQLAALVSRTLRDTELTRVYGEKGIERVNQKFTWDKMAERWLQLSSRVM